MGLHHLPKWLVVVLAFAVPAVVASDANKNQNPVQDEASAPISELDAQRVRDEARVQEILSRDPQLEDYTDLERCISTGRIRSVEVIDDQHLSFRLSRNQYYLAKLPHRCPGLERGKPVMYEPTATRLCALDGIRAIYDHGLAGATPGMRCALDGFQSVTKEQLVMLKDTLKAERRRPNKRS